MSVRSPFTLALWKKIDMNTELSKPFNGCNRIMKMELLKLTAKGRNKITLISYSNAVRT